MTQTQPTQFRPDVAKQAYTEQEWQLKEKWYVEETAKLQFKVSPSTSEVQNFALAIDRILTVARMDFAFVDQKYDRFMMQKKIEETRQFVAIKQAPPQQFQNMKFTVDELKGAVATVISNTPWAGTSLSLYELVQMFSYRRIFMEGVIKLLQDKKDLLITHNGILKIENSLSSMQPSAPKSYGDN